MDIRLKVKETLDAVFYPLGIMVDAEECLPEGPLPEEYITVSVIHSRKTNWASNRPTARRYNIDVNYFSDKPLKKTVRTEEIIGAMEAAGFRTINSGSDIPTVRDSRGERTRYYGVTLEFEFTGWGWSIKTPGATAPPSFLKRARGWERRELGRNG